MSNNPTPDNSSENREVSVEARAREIADKVCLDVCELPDRTSPDDWPEACLVTSDELHLIVSEAIIAALTQSNASPEDAVEAERENPNADT